jgi:hypothetical protein
MRKLLTVNTSIEKKYLLIAVRAVTDMLRVIILLRLLIGALFNDFLSFSYLRASGEKTEILNLIKPFHRNAHLAHVKMKQYI